MTDCRAGIHDHMFGVPAHEFRRGQSCLRRVGNGDIGFFAGLAYDRRQFVMRTVRRIHEFVAGGIAWVEPSLYSFRTVRCVLAEDDRAFF
jgi:hypothetical protein